LLFILLVLLGCVLLGVLLFGVRRGQAKRAQRQAQRALQVQTAQATELLANEIAATIHDGPAQALAVSIIRLETLLEDWPDGQPAPASLREPLTRVVEVLKDTADELHHVARNNKLPEMTGLPLNRVLARVVSDFQAQTGTVVATDWGDESGALVASDTVNGVVFRCVREALFNSLKHADGHGLSVCLRADDSRVVIQITDEGPGFNPTAGAASERLGLRLLQERVKSIDGQLRFYANVPRGAGIEISFDVRD
jgi:signal transduction histidine kinase